MTAAGTQSTGGGGTAAPESPPRVPPDLVPALRRQLAVLEDDLRARVEGSGKGSGTVAAQEGVHESWRAEYEAALKAERTAASWQAWRDERVTQAAVAWILLTVFARYCEDNALVTPVWIAGPDGDARQQALDARAAYFRAHPERTDRDWLAEIIAHFAGLDATAGLVDEYSPIHQVAPSGDAARALLEFWWDRDDAGDYKWVFTGVDTRFLGDMYQDLSEHAQKTYALLQTPEFVEEFILDHTLEPALEQRKRDNGGALDAAALAGFTIIDPTCGSGHFLLGAFDRLLARWQQAAPSLEPRVLVGKALGGVFGVDVNPFAVAIARFRLIVAALEASGDSSIEKLIDVELNLAAGDSLLWGARQQALDGQLWSAGAGEPVAYAIEDAERLQDILQRSHDVVVGNPPYITVKDKAANQTYRQLYHYCKGTYALTVPFMELFFDLARTGTNGDAGWVGQITSNSFMKREFGSKLIEEFLARKDLTRVIDTSGAYIPGHGTPTVVLIGRNRAPVAKTVRAVMGIRGEPGRPDDPAEGIVWSSIREHADDPGFDNGWVSVDELDRKLLAQHPWSLTGGGAVQLTGAIDSAAQEVLRSRQKRIGFFGDSHADEAFFFPTSYATRIGAPSETFIASVRGEDVRDWDGESDEFALFPYGDSRTILPLSALDSDSQKMLWGLRTTLGSRSTFGGGTYISSGRAWYEWHQLPRDPDTSALSIAFAFVATHNHFVLDRGGKVFNRSAPVIKLPEGATVVENLGLLGVLNSSVACFWLKQNSHNKGEGGGARVEAGYAARGEPWRESYEFTGTTLKNFPLPSSLPVEYARRLDDLASELAEHAPTAVCGAGVPTREALEAARSESERIRGLMIAVQEELDWHCYRLYGLIDEDLTYIDELPQVASEHRAFAIDLARAVAAGDDTSWFTHHNHRYTPSTVIPAVLPSGYQELVQRRLDIIAGYKQIGLLEKPEHKRRWQVEPWSKRVTAALRDWLLDRVEDRRLWFDADGYAMPASVGQLADVLDRDVDFRSVLRLWAGNADVATDVALGSLLAEEGVPYLAAWRYKEPGMDKRAAWEHTWDLQRHEDAGESLDGPIPVPPKYKPADFRKGAYWSRRGKLDVPKERFISYPQAGRETDPTVLLGWAGWDHAEQALALASLVGDRVDDGWGADRLTPMLAGLAELSPWVRQWHGEVDPEFGESISDTIDEELRSRCAQVGVTADELAAWRPPKATRGRRKKTG